MKEEGSRTATWIEHALFKRSIDCVPRHFSGEPVWRVILTETVPLFPVDQRFVKRLQHVRLDFGQPESPDVIHNPPNQRLALRVGGNPIEKVALDCTADFSRREGVAGEQALRLVLDEPHYGNRDAFSDDHEKRVLKPKLVAFDFPAVNKF